MKRKCVLHVGTMKTGTTSIQAWLRDNNDWLHSQGWHYPGWPLRTDSDIENAISDKKRKNLVISDEGLWALATTPKSDTRQIKKVLRKFDTQVVVYLRRPDHYLESWYLQGLKAGTSLPDLDRWLSLEGTGVEAMRQRLDLFVDLWGPSNITVAPYERSQMKDDSVVDDFLSRTPIPVPVPEVAPGPAGSIARNVSPDPDLLMIVSLLRHAFEIPQPLLLKVLNKGRNSSVDLGRQSILTLEQAAEIRERFRPFYREVQERFGTGAETDFIQDWSDDSRGPVATLRDVYSEYIRKLGPDGDV